MKTNRQYLQVRQRIPHDGVVDGVGADVVVEDVRSSSGVQHGPAEAGVVCFQRKQEQGLIVLDDGIEAVRARLEAGDGESREVAQTEGLQRVRLEIGKKY